MFGMSRSGKSQFIRSFWDPSSKDTHHPFSETYNCDVTSYVFENDEQIYNINIMDTPGFFEQSLLSSRSNEDLFKLVRSKIVREMSKINLILICLKDIRDEEIMMLKLSQEYFGVEFIKKFVVLVTHSEFKGETVQRQWVSNFKKKTEMTNLPNYDDRIYFTGCMPVDVDDTVLQNLTLKQEERNYRMLKLIVNSDDLYIDDVKSIHIKYDEPLEIILEEQSRLMTRIFEAECKWKAITEELRLYLSRLINDKEIKDGKLCFREEPKILEIHSKDLFMIQQDVYKLGFIKFERSEEVLKAIKTKIGELIASHEIRLKEECLKRERLKKVFESFIASIKVLENHRTMMLKIIDEVNISRRSK